MQAPQVTCKMSHIFLELSSLMNMQSYIELSLQGSSGFRPTGMPCNSPASRHIMVHVWRKPAHHVS